MRKLEKDEKKFIFVLLGFAFLMAIRIFDHILLFHSAPMGIMQNYSFAQLSCALLYICAFIMMTALLKISEKKNSRCICYVDTFLVIFIIPMYLYTDYFGAMDVYMWTLLFVGILCTWKRQFEFIWLIISFPIGAICPMAIVYVLPLMICIQGYLYMISGEKKYTIVAIAESVLLVLGALINWKLGVSSPDVQNGLSFRKFIIIMLLLVFPYMIAHVRFLKKILSFKKEKNIYRMLLLCWLPAFAVSVWLGDYNRAIFMYFVLAIVALIFVLGMRDVEAWKTMEIMEREVEEKCPIPVMIIAYPFVFNILWMYGPLQLIVETLLGK